MSAALSQGAAWRVLQGFGGAVRAACLTAAPQSVAELQALVCRAAQEGVPLIARAAGRSYNDAALSSDGVVLDLRGLDKVLAWDSERGVLEAEPGVTVDQVWRTCLPDGYWPPVVPGTMRATLGGCLAANVHGKNHFQLGTFGEHLLGFEWLKADGALQWVEPGAKEAGAHPFHAVVGAGGLFGCATRLRLQLRRVHSGRLRVTPFHAPNLQALLERLETEVALTDYAVGWVDGAARGRSLGRGLLHTGTALGSGEDAQAQSTFSVVFQEPSATVVGLPKSQAWRALAPFLHPAPLRWLNAGRYARGALWETRAFLQSYVAFSFMLDYAPGWERAYGPDGLVQFQPTVPRVAAATLLPELLRRCHARGFAPTLGVLKRHRPDDFLVSYAADGYSLALDFRWERARRAALRALMRELSDAVLDAGGAFYLAKDCWLDAAQAQRMLGPKAKALADFKRRVDPANLWQSDLWRRWGFPSVGSA